MSLACSHRHPFASRKFVKWAESQGETPILADRATLPLIAKDSQYQAVFTRNHQVGHFTTALALASANRGVVVSPNFASTLTASFNVALVPLVEPVSFHDIMLYHNRRYTMSPAAERIAENPKKLLAPLRWHRQA